jgi:hypothetical protein
MFSFAVLNKLSTYPRLSLLVAFCLCLTCGASAQQLFTVKGVVFKKNTPTTLSFVSVNNTTRKTLDGLSDELGSFHIEAALGDTLVFKRTDYAPQYIVVQNYLKPVCVHVCHDSVRPGYH